VDDDFDIAWINNAAEAAGLDALEPEQVDALLDLAGVAARESGDRRNAPLLCYLAGLGLASDEITPEKIRAFHG